MNAKILIVDDEQEACQDISCLMQMKGYKTTIANSAAEALSKLLAEKPDLILLDIHMPDMDGLECLREIRKLSQDVLVIMITCVTDINSAKTALELGAVEYLVKPVGIDVLERVIVTHLFLKSDKYFN